MRYNRKSNRERKDSVVKFRLNQIERKQLEAVSKSTGLTFSNIIRHRVLDKGVTSREEFDAIVHKAIAESVEYVLKLSKRGHRSESEWKRILYEKLLQKVRRVTVDYAMKDIELEEKFRRNRSA